MEAIENLPFEIVSNVLNFMSANELMNLSNSKTLPKNLNGAINHSPLWQRKILHVKNGADMRRCLMHLNKVKNCKIISFASSQTHLKDVLRLIRGFEAVEYLSFNSFVDLDDHVFQSIIEQHGKSLKHIDVSGCQYLTNYSLKLISRSCNSLNTLLITGCSFSAAGLDILAENDRILTNLRVLDTSKCYLLDNSSIHPLAKFTALQKLKLSHLDWLNANNLPYILSPMRALKTVDIRNCEDFTQLSVRKVLESLGREVEILENTKLVDDSPESIRGYLMALINSRAVY